MFGRKTNRRQLPRRMALTLALSSAWRTWRPRFVVLLKVAATAGCVAAAVVGAKAGWQHVIASQRFTVREIVVDAKAHVGRSEILALAGVAPGDRLLDIDPDDVAARIAANVWIASASVRRELPGRLLIEVTERRPVALAALGALYLLDEAGRPIKRASLDESEGMPVITGVDRDFYVQSREVAEAAFRASLALLDAWHARPGRPTPGEVHAAASGFTLFFSAPGSGAVTEVRLGKGLWPEKLARFDAIVAAVDPDARAALRVIHLEDVDGSSPDRIPVLLARAP